MKKLFSALLCVTALLFGVMTSSANHRNLYTEPLYGITFFGQELIRVDPGTGDASLINRLSSPVNAYGLASRYGRLYTFDPALGGVVEIDPVNGNVGRVIPVGNPSGSGEGDIAFRSDGIAFLSVAFDAANNPLNGVFAVDVLAGTSRYVGPCLFPYDALAFDTNDVLYALAQGQGKLYIINQNTGSGSPVGELGVAMNSPFAGMSFAPDGTLYAAVDDRLFRINTANGAATPVSTTIDYTGYSSISGLTFESGPPSQELVGISFFTGQLVRVDPFTGEAEQLGPFSKPDAPSPIAPFGLANYSNRLYTFDGKSSRIVELDPASGSAVETNSIQFNGINGEGDIAIAKTGIGFVSAAFSQSGEAQNGLFRFTLTNGTSQLVGVTPFPLDALAFNNKGDLYALGQGRGSLYMVNQTNAELSIIGTNLTVPQNSPFAGMTFTSDGRLLAAIDDHIYGINVETGNATILDTNYVAGVSSISGLTVVPVTRLDITRETNRVIVSAPIGARLQSAGVVTGPYQDVQPNNNPLLLDGNSASNQFFRAKR